MKLSAREKVMLIVLGILAILAASYYLVLVPQLAKIDQLTIEREAVSQKVEEVKKEIASGGKLKKDFEEQDKNIQEKTIPFFPEILQPKLIVTLDSLFKESAINVNSMEFTPRTISTVETIEPNIVLIHPTEILAESYKLMTGTATSQGAIDLINQITSASNTSGAAVQGTEGTAQGSVPIAITEKMTITLQYDKTSYEQVTAFIKALEAQKRTLVVNSLNMESTENNQLKGTIAITFYALPKLHDQDAEYLGWTYNNLYGKNNPFIK